MVSAPLNISPTPYARHPNSLAKYFTHVFLCLSRLIMCLYSSDSPVLSLMIEFAVIFRYMWYDMPSGVFWYCDTIISGHTLLYTFLNHFYVWWGICVPVGGRLLPGPLPTSVVNTPFLCTGVGVGFGGFFLQSYSFLGFRVMVQPLLADSPSEVDGSYFSFFPQFWPVFQLSQVFFLWFFLGRYLPVF